MTSQALDLTTMGHALNELCNAFLGDSEWEGINERQQEFLSWYTAHRDEITKLSNLEALASTDFEELNNFLIARGFDPMFSPFEGIGVASILDMLVEWVIKGELTTISRYEEVLTPGLSTARIHAGPTDGSVGYLTLQKAVDYPAFKITADNVDIYDESFVEPLVRLRTKTGASLWLMKSGEPASGLELNRVARQLLAETALRPDPQWTAGVIVPMLEMDITPNLSWMIGTTAISPTQGKYAVQQAFQKFKLRANEIGAHVKVLTGMVMVSACATTPPPPPYVLNDPFIGFFTQPGNDTLPLAAFWADTDTWQNPGGTLEEL